MSDFRIFYMHSHNVYGVVQLLSICPSYIHIICMCQKPSAMTCLPRASSSKPSKVDFSSSSLLNIYPQEKCNLLCVFARLFEMSYRELRSCQFSLAAESLCLVFSITNVSLEIFDSDFSLDCVAQSFPFFQTDGCIGCCCLLIFFSIICFHQHFSTKE